MDVHNDASSPGSYSLENSENENYNPEPDYAYSIQNINHTNSTESYSSHLTPSTDVSNDSDESLSYRNCYPNKSTEESQDGNS